MSGDPLDRWTHYRTRVQEVRHPRQPEDIWLLKALARHHPTARPDIVRGGQPWRTIFPPGLDESCFLRVGWDRPKAYHCPVLIELDLL